MKEKIAIGVFIFSIFIAAVLLLFAFRGDISGRVVEGIDTDNLAEVQDFCSDSDGWDYNLKGKVEYCKNGKCVSEEDACSGKNVIELFCEGNEKKQTEKECESCDDGKCVSLATKYRYPYAAGGGGGGAATSAPAPVASSSGQTYDLGELDTGQGFEILKEDSFRFSISGIYYSFTLKDNSETQATIEGHNQIFGLYSGQERIIDLNNDNVPDVSMRVSSINIINKKVSLLLIKM